ncbi:MAG: DUF4290 domain-containing protein [Prevotellaceae bacterium]|jgi:hypothetical protein|nr:DUF4290 domain-containing protein [Prevotellaceae bacterium]
MKEKNNIKFAPRTDLIMPEYGRNIQNLVEYAVKIEDREQRNLCAQAIINLMGNMFPYLRDVEGFKFKLWDHLAIMSRFKLDIDYPFDVIKQENFTQKPVKLPYNSRKMSYLHYGATIERFIATACNMPEDEQRSELVITIANYMKKSLLAWNKEIADDKKVIDDLHYLSKGKIALQPDTLRLISQEDMQAQQQQRSRQKANNNNNKGKKNRKR